MIILNTLSILINVVFIVFLTLLYMNIVRIFTSGTRKMVLLAPALFVNHGGGPMPLIGDKEHIGLINFLRNEVKKHINLSEVKAIILVTAHWQENKVVISSNEHHSLYFDYYGFPPETYKYTYDAPGSPDIAGRIHKTLKENGIDAKLDPNRGWDHGVFVPMLLIRPEADVPIIQVSILNNQDPEQHYNLGKILYKFRKEGIAVLGSGMSYHNMREFMYGRNKNEVVNKEFDDYLFKICTAEDEEKRKKGFSEWHKQPGASQAHPPRAADHLMPLIVVAGAGGSKPGERIFNWDMSGIYRLSAFVWKDE